jgi:hypothetical protein
MTSQLYNPPPPLRYLRYTKITNLPHTPPARARFTYIGKETKYITEPFKNTTVRIAPTTNITI